MAFNIEYLNKNVWVFSNKYFIKKDSVLYFDFFFPFSKLMLYNSLFINSLNSLASFNISSKELDGVSELTSEILPSLRMI